MDVVISWLVIAGLLLFALAMFTLVCLQLLWKLTLILCASVLWLFLQVLNLIAWILKIPDPAPRNTV